MDRGRVKAVIRPSYPSDGRHDEPPAHFIVEAVQPLLDHRAQFTTLVVDRSPDRRLIAQVLAYQQFFGLPFLGLVEVAIEERFFRMAVVDPQRLTCLEQAVDEANQTIRARLHADEAATHLPE